MQVFVDPTQEPSKNFGYVAAGDYELIINACEEKQKDGSPHKYLKWTLNFADQNLKAVDTNTQLGSIYCNTTLKPGAQFVLRNLVEALGFDWTNFDTDDAIGLSIMAKIKVREYNGNLTNEITKFLPASAS